MANIAPTPQEKLNELAKRLRAYPDDPVGFARDILDVDPHLGQQRWLVRTNFGLEAYNALTTGNRWGKCLTGTTLVRLADGTCKPISTVKAGDTVVGVNLDGTTNAAKVLEVHDNGIQPVYKHLFSKRGDEASFVSTLEHKMLARPESASSNSAPRATKTNRRVLSRKGTPTGLTHRIVPVKDLNNRWLALRTKGYEPTSSGMDEEYAFIFGLLIGDGSYTHTRDVIQYTCAEADLVEHARIEFEKLGYSLHKSWQGSTIQYNVSVFHRDTSIETLQSVLRRNNLRGYAYEKIMPIDICRWSNDAVSKLIAGLYLTDGSVDKGGYDDVGSNGHIAFYSSSYGLITELKTLLAERFGIYGSSIYAHQRDLTEARPTSRAEYSFSIGNYASIVRFSKAIPLMGRKLRLLNELIADWKGKRSDSAELVYRGSEFVGYEQTYDITIDNDTHLFALANGLVVSNSHAAAIRLIHRAVYRKGWTASVGAAMARKHEGYHAINISNTADQANIVHDKAMGMLQGPKAAWLVDKFTSSPFLETRLVNKSIIEARSTAHNGNHLLGHSYDFVNFDEAAFSTNFTYIMDNVLKMRVADRKGVIDFTSTGNGRNQYGRFFLDGLEGRNPDLYCQVGPSYENPHTNHDRIASNARSMSERMRMQNIEGAIVDAGGEYFDPVDLDAAHNPLFDEMAYIRMDSEEEVALMELRPDGTPWRWKYPTHKYVTGWDLADKKDYMTGFTFDISVAPAVLVEFQRFHKMGWEHNIAQMRATDDKYGVKSTKFDSTGVGDVVGDHLKDIRAEGINFSGTRKDEVLTNLRVVLSQRAIQFPYILVMQNELRSYDRDDEKLMTDCVMGLAVACWWVKRTRRYSFAGTV